LTRFSEIVLASHVFVPKDEVDLDEEYCDCVARDKFEGMKIPLYKEVGEWFGYPRYWWPDPSVLSENIRDARQDGSPINLTMRMEPLEKQVPVIRKFLQLIARGSTGFLLEARPGWGKTHVLLRLISEINRTALVIVPKADLIDQWIDRLMEHTNIKRSEIGSVSGRRASWKGKKVVVALVHSLGLDYLKKDFRMNFGQVWYDEVHASTPPKTFAPISSMFAARYRGGASATPYRADGLHVIFQKHIGESYLKGDDGNRMPAQVVAYYFPFSSGSIPGHLGKNQRRGMLLSALARNIRRNVVLSELSMDLYRSGRRFVIISDRTEQLWSLREMLSQRHGVPAREMGFYCRSLQTPSGPRTLTNEQNARVASDCTVILATYPMMKLGTDIPDLGGIVYATPQSDPRQSKGRIERYFEGKQSPMVVDLIDSAHGDAVGWWKNRYRWYQQERLDIKFIR
jgi:superfamily II DNA or RNA helicase